jgi:hypothetical protein
MASRVITNIQAELVAELILLLSERIERPGKIAGCLPDSGKK